MFHIETPARPSNESSAWMGRKSPPSSAVVFLLLDLKIKPSIAICAVEALSLVRNIFSHQENAPKSRKYQKISLKTKKYLSHQEKFLAPSVRKFDLIFKRSFLKIRAIFSLQKTFLGNKIFLLPRECSYSDLVFFIYQG